MEPLTERGFVLSGHLNHSEEQLGASQPDAGLVRCEAGPAGPAMTPGPPSRNGLFRRAVVIVLHWTSLFSAPA